MMKRLKPGEYLKMTPEEQLAHRRLLRNRWLRKKGNKKRVREWNKQYNHQYWEARKDKPFVAVCAKCGQETLLTGRRTICDKCKETPSKTKLLLQKKREIAEMKSQAKKNLIINVINLAKHTDLTQKQIAEIAGTHQPVVSKILIQNKVKRRPK